MLSDVLVFAIISHSQPNRIEIICSNLQGSPQSNPSMGGGNTTQPCWNKDRKPVVTLMGSHISTIPCEQSKALVLVLSVN